MPLTGVLPRLLHSVQGGHAWRPGGGLCPRLPEKVPLRRISQAEPRPPPWKPPQTSPTEASCLSFWGGSSIARRPPWIPKRTRWTRNSRRSWSPRPLLSSVRTWPAACDPSKPPSASPRRSCSACGGFGLRTRSGWRRGRLLAGALALAPPLPLARRAWFPPLRTGLRALARPSAGGCGGWLFLRRRPLGVCLRRCAATRRLRPSPVLCTP